MKYSSKPQWLIPQKYTLTSPEQCLRLLALGYTLINNHGYTVQLRNDKQYKTNSNRNKNYRFSNPQLWQVLDVEKSRITVLQDVNSWSFRIQNLYVTFCRKWL